MIDIGTMSAEADGLGDRGPEELSVHFDLSEGGDGRESDDRTAARALGQEVEVHARCVGGAPSFTLGG